VVGTYAIKNSLMDVYWMLGFGIFGYFLKTYGFQVGPIILGVILGPLMDESYRQAVMSTRNNVPAFLLDLVTNPLSLVLTLAVIFMLVNQTRLWPWVLKFFKRKKAQIN
jgi:putative tricarboxylic transport membrane protein